MRRAALAVGLLLGAAAPTPVLTLSGHLAHPRALAAGELAALPQVSVEAFAGPLLWPLLDQAGWVDAPGRKTHLQHVVLARGQDGYAVALSIAELDPAFEGKPVIVAITRDGKPLPTPALMVPGDKRAGRRVHDLVAVEVR